MSQAIKERLDVITEAIQTVINECTKEGLTFEFVGAFAIFDNDDHVKETKKVGYGYHEGIGQALDALQNELIDDEDDFINW